MEEKKDIEVVTGDGSNLNISPVYDYVNGSKPSTDKKPKNIVIPKEKNKKKKK